MARFCLVKGWNNVGIVLFDRDNGAAAVVLRLAFVQLRDETMMVLFRIRPR